MFTDDTYFLAIIQTAIKICLFICLLLFIALVFNHGKKKIFLYRKKKVLENWTEQIKNIYDAVKYKKKIKYMFDFIPIWSQEFEKSNYQKKKLFILLANQNYMRQKIYFYVKVSQVLKLYKYYTLVRKQQFCFAIHFLGNYYQNRPTTSVESTIYELSLSDSPLIAYESSIALLKINPSIHAMKILHYLKYFDSWTKHELKYLAQYIPLSTMNTFIMRQLEKKVTLQSFPLLYQLILFCSTKENILKYILLNYKEFTKEEVSFAIKNIENPENFKIIERFKETNNWFILVAIIHSISNLKIRTPKQVMFLLKMLKHENWWVKTRSAQSLCSIYEYNDFYLTPIIKSIENMDDKKVVLNHLKEKMIINKKWPGHQYKQILKEDNNIAQEEFMSS